MDRIIVSEEEFDELLDLLDEPAKEMPRLRKLLEAEPFEQR